MPRVKPVNAEFFSWDKFEEFADSEGIGESIDGDDSDWMPWWECWKTAYKTAMNS